MIKNIKEKAILAQYKKFEPKLLSCKTQKEMIEIFNNNKTFFNEFYNLFESSIKSGNFFVQYQPTVINSRCSGAEALFRCEIDDTKINPMIAFALAKHNDFEKELNILVFNRVCEDAKTFIDNISPDFKIGFNLSGELCNKEFVDEFYSILAKNNVPSENMVIELLETSPFDKLELEVVNDILSRGTCVALDDFGAGFSTEETLKSFPFTHLKFAGSLIRDIDKNVNNQEIVSRVVSYCQENGIKTIHENVETKEELDTVNQLSNNTAIIQGYYYSAPKAPDDLIAFANGLSEANLTLEN